MSVPKVAQDHTESRVSHARQHLSVHVIIVITSATSLRLVKNVRSAVNLAWLENTNTTPGRRISRSIGLVSHLLGRLQTPKIT